MKFTKNILIAVIFILNIIILASCSNSSNNEPNKFANDHTNNVMPEIMPEDFKIVFEFGVHQAKQQDSLNTIEHVITKDLVLDGLGSVESFLDTSEMESIYNELVKINIIDYPRTFLPPYQDNPEPNVLVYCSTSMVYRLKIFYNGLSYDLYWHNKNCSKSEKALILNECFDKIIRIICNTEEYKSLPEINGGYD